MARSWRASCFSLITILSTCAAQPQPLQVPASTEWFGDDGTWSAVNLRIGSPQQWVSLYPSTVGQDTWVIGSSGCDDTTLCVETRGGIFKANSSTTWRELGGFDLNFQPELGNTGTGYYGLDTIAVQESTVAQDQIVGIVNDTSYLLGFFGLGVIPSNFSAQKNTPTFLDTLVENTSAIPSHSYGYTAGAHYRLKGVPASLTLGGIDTKRFTPNDISFDLATGFEPVVAINQITVTSSPLAISNNKPTWADKPLELVTESQAELYTIDSSTPFLWLPEDVCDAFAAAMNLTYNETLQLYTYSESANLSTLEDWNMDFVFTLADLPGSSKSIDIKLPFDAFHHQLKFPYPALNTTFGAAPVDYFPLRKAANNTQYTIGRVLLQEAYLAVDYERNNFSLSQTVFSNDVLTNINLVGITKPDKSYFGSSQGSSGLSTGAKAGIGAGAGILALLILVGAFLCLRKRRRNAKDEPESPHEKGFFHKLSYRLSNRDAKASPAEAKELIGDKHHPLEVAADKDTSRFELPEAAPVEMPAEVPSSFYTGYSRAAELEHQNSTAKNGHPQHRASKAPSLPPYSPAQVGRQSASHVSPDSRSQAGTNTLSSGISNFSPSDVSPRTAGGQVSPHTATGLTPHTPNTAPISPPEPSPLLMPGIGGSDGFRSRSSLNLPKTERDRDMPSRSVSRASKFTEEGMQRESMPPVTRKFSFEDRNRG